ncbi:MAG: thiamine phosphate synthase [Candidatus Omnitrophica bacterium]|nr:thiamine phosphate synthase [Candidatus Omnitrophota bacterium]
MHSKKKQLSNSRLYCIVDVKKRPLEIKRLLKKITSAGVDIVQLREKTEQFQRLLTAAKLIKANSSKTKPILIINDRVDIARLSSADGVHLGQSDITIKDARKILGPGKIVGISCHSLAQAKRAQASGADYISIGPIYKTPTKKGVPAIGERLLSEVSNKINIPVFAIGGINRKNLDKIKRKGIKRIAVHRAITRAKNPAGEATRLKQLLRCN